MITITGKFLFDKQKLTRFATKVNNLHTTAEKVNNSLLTALSSEIRQTLKDDPRPSFSNPRWIGHDYTGSLISSVKHETRSKAGYGKSYILSKVGYFVPHGTNIEPPADVKNNIFVPRGWAADWNATLSGKTKATESVFPENLSESALFKWAVDLLTNRDLDRGGKSTDPKNIRRRARRLARKYYITLQDGTFGYPIIIPLFEKHAENNNWFDQIFNAVQKKLGMDVPF